MIIIIITIDNVKPMYEINESGTVTNVQTGKVLKPYLNKNGYLYVSLMQLNNKPKKYPIHRLMTRTFLKDDGVVNHIDGNKLNNHLWNLEISSLNDNYTHARLHGLIKLGDELSYASLTNDQVHAICGMLSDGCDYSHIINTLQIEHVPNIEHKLNSIFKRRRWKHISSQYIWDTKSKNSLFTDNDIHIVCMGIRDGMKIKEIHSLLNKYNYDQIKKLVWHIKKGNMHRDISYQYGIVEERSTTIERPFIFKVK